MQRLAKKTKYSRGKTDHYN